ncbi:MAG: hypothetical protein AAFY20_01845 [Cyanobacteria bacterium J06639_14]
MKRQPLVVIFLICLSLSFCHHISPGIVFQSRQSPQHPRGESPVETTLSTEAMSVTLQVEATQPEPNQLRVAGRTNLPDGFVMRVNVCRMLVKPEESSSAKFTRGSCGVGTYIEFQDIKVTEGRLIAWFEVPTVEAARQIQLDYIKQGGASQWHHEAVPWEFVRIDVNGYPNLQSDEILSIIGGSEGHNLTGVHVREHRNTAPGKEANPYNYVTWETNLKM